VEANGIPIDEIANANVLVAIVLAVNVFEEANKPRVHCGTMRIGDN
jgi:hypothetical protein